MAIFFKDKEIKNELLNKDKYTFLLGTLGTPSRCIANTGFVVGKT
tara:strand:- start:258 stop:392 length:135 start_codon:yes stop_codon:yes gene_type:complete